MSANNNTFNNERTGHGPRGQESRAQNSWRSNQNQQKYGNERQYDGNKPHYSYNNSNPGRFQSNQYQNARNFRDNQSYGYSSDVEISKEIVRIVRHGKYKWIKMDKEGYVKVNEILSDKRFQTACGPVKFDDVQRIVDKNDKKRFEMKSVGDEWYIKAVQGHTVQVEALDLAPVVDPFQYPNVFHGTYDENWEMIKKTGLNRMQRNHIHFAIGLADDPSVVSGMRKSCQIAIEIDMEKAMKDGIKFFISSNKVILSEGDSKGRIHPKFFRRVIRISGFQMVPFQIPPDYDDEGGKVSNVRGPSRHIPGYSEQPPPKQQPGAPKSKPETPHPDQFENPVDKVKDVNIPESEAPKAVEAPQDNVKNQEKKVPEIEEKDTKLGDEQTNANNMEAKNEATEQVSDPAKNKKKRRKKNKNQDASETAPAVQPTEIKFELPNQSKPKKKTEEIKFEKPTAYNTGKKQNSSENIKEANKAGNSKPSKSSKGKNNTGNEQAPSKSQAKENTQETGSSKRRKAKKKR